MIVYTIGYTKKTAESFFSSIRSSDIKLLLDVRLNNNSQLAGFSKSKDLEYFLNKICDCKYQHHVEMAPDKTLLDDYKNSKHPISWSEYEIRFANIIKKRNIIEKFPALCENFNKICLLCSEATPEHCHRRLIAEALHNKYGYSVVHL